MHKVSFSHYLPNRRAVWALLWLFILLPIAVGAFGLSLSVTSPTTSGTYYTAGSEVIVSGTASEDATQISWASSAGPSGTCDGVSEWVTPEIALTVGTNTITITASDADGNTQELTLTVVYDLEGPKLNITSPSKKVSTVFKDTLNLLGSASDPAGVEGLIWSSSTGASGACSGTTNWSAVKVPLQFGSQIITVTAADKLGNTTSASVEVIYNDGTLPVVTITKPTANSTYTCYADTVNVQGTSSDDVGVNRVEWSFNGGDSQPCTGTTAWSTGDIHLLVGENLVEVTAYDDAGNFATSSIRITHPDTIPPRITITGPTDEDEYSTFYAYITLSGTASDNGELDSISWTNNLGGSGECVGTYNWSASGIPLKHGNNYIAVTCKDKAGNKASDYIMVTYTDITVPEVKITSPTSEEVYDTTCAVIDVGGVASDDSDLDKITWETDGGRSGICSGSTTWLATGIPLKPGSNQITITAIDRAANKAIDTLVVTFTDTTAPEINITNPLSEVVERYPNNKTDISGTASDDVGVVSVNWYKSTGETGLCTGLTNWSAKGIPLDLGDNHITVTARDAAGNESSATVTICYLDGDGPVVTIKVPTTQPKYNCTQQVVALGGTAVDVNVVEKVVWSNNRGGGGDCLGTQNWQVAEVQLQQGENIITVTATDNSGNKGSDVITIIVPDTTPPVIKIQEPTELSNYSTHVAEIVLSGTASDNIGVTIVTASSSRGGAIAVNGTTKWVTSPIKLQLGTNVITMTAKDAAGKSSTATLNISFTDVTPPAISIISPFAEADYETALSSITVTGIATDDVKVSEVTWAVDSGAKGKATGTNTWTASAIPLRLGKNVITFTCTDSSGNSSTAKLTAVLIDTPPTVSITQPTKSPAYTTASSPINISGVASDEVGLVTVTWANDKGGSGMCAGTEKWSATGIALKPGPNNITVTATDTGGLTATATLLVSLTDTKPPVVAITAPTRNKDYTTDAAAISLAGTAKDNVQLADVKWESGAGSGDCTGLEDWKVENIPLVKGKNVIKIMASDTSGLVGTATLNVTYNPPDVTPPSIRITSPTMEKTYSIDTPTIALGGTASDDNIVKTINWASDSGGKGSVRGAENWTISGIKLSAGVTRITVTALDAAGNSASDYIDIMLVDNKAPTVKISSPSTSGQYTSSRPSVALGGSASDNIGVTKVLWSTSRGESGECTGTAAWKTPAIAISPGITVITITAVDCGGNMGTAQLSVSYAPNDRTPPEIQITHPTTAARYVTAFPTINLRGNVTDNVAVAQVYYSNDRSTAGKAVGTGEWSVDKIALLPGVNIITITAEDTAGNRSMAQLEVNYSDTAAIVITRPSDEGYCKWVGEQVPIGGHASSPLGIAEIFWSNDLGDSGECSTDEPWSAMVPLHSGLNSISVSATDKAGSTATEEIKIERMQADLTGVWKGLCMVSLPIIPVYEDPKTALGFAEMKWASYDGEEARYYTYPSKKTWFTPCDKVQGSGWWAVFDSEVEIPIGELAPQEVPVQIKLYPGWNLFGMPFIKQVKFSVTGLTVRDADGNEKILADATNMVTPFVWGWQQNAKNPMAGEYFLVSDPDYAYVDRGVLEPWRAYWIKAYTECTLIIPPGGTR